MGRRLIHAYVVLGWFAAAVCFFAGGAAVARADSETPSAPVFEGGVWSTGGVAIICAVALVVITIGIILIRRARSRRRPS